MTVIRLRDYHYDRVIFVGHMAGVRKYKLEHPESEGSIVIEEITPHYKYQWVNLLNETIDLGRSMGLLGTSDGATKKKA